MRVGLLLGCVQDTFFSHVNAATARVLAAEGCEVVFQETHRLVALMFGAMGIHESARVQLRRV